MFCALKNIAYDCNPQIMNLFPEVNDVANSLMCKKKKDELVMQARVRLMKFFIPPSETLPKWALGQKLDDEIKYASENAIVTKVAEAKREEEVMLKKEMCTSPLVKKMKARKYSISSNEETSAKKRPRFSSSYNMTPTPTKYQLGLLGENEENISSFSPSIFSPLIVREALTPLKEKNENEGGSVD